MFALLKKKLRHCYDSVKQPVYFLSYPKAGRTWLRIMISDLLFPNLPLDKRIELTQLTRFHPTIKTIIFSHRGYRDLQTLKQKLFPGKNNIIVLIRDPRDILVSSYHQHTKRSKVASSTNISDFARDPEFGIERIVQYYNEIIEVYSDRIISIVRYEDLKEDPVSELNTLLTGTNLQRQEISITSIKEAVTAASFASLQEKSKSSSNPRLKPSTKDKPDSYKFRKGVVGDHINYFVGDDLLFLNTICRSLHGTYGYSFD